ncbi:hypothetical protein PTTG_05787 [Puccinia triticina 1-1 BBBD Race 1]|uniref:Uncharacterized protein n=2 Tax=Puccinia triticina TaxID=208348 RepID=A0A0C4EY88_PUCT1|nr:uncharacterized protein PtA15_6A801 [Puccinia triticina]OAV97088.1 hypothetical protein PTTG_05787 [Puccinia triticina 1-1 BBBD Race 1]WAQ86169.1 hypothetical protein PtA15_6A801 [Puccinia triticina]WAR56056.1 hypothetical protein PtB15_6B800 [Puccinia triticina]
MISKLALTNPILSAPISVALGSDNYVSGKHSDSTSSHSKAGFWSRKQPINSMKNAISHIQTSDKRLSSHTSGLEPRMDTLEPFNTKSSINVPTRQSLSSHQDSTRTPSLSSSISTKSSDSDLLESSEADTTELQQIVLYQSTSSNASRFCGPSFTKSNEVQEEMKMSRGGVLLLPTIVLTPPDDEDDYCTVSPFILELFCPYTTDSVVHQNLQVPTAPKSKGIEANSKRRKYPHPAGPWLRPHHTADLRVSGKSAVSSSPLANQKLTWRWEDGCRTAQGIVVGWGATVSYFIKKYNYQNKLKEIGTKHCENLAPAVVVFPPPRLPNEKEIQQRQLQFTIEQSVRLGQKVHRKRQNHPMSFHHKASQPVGDLK